MCYKSVDIPFLRLAQLCLFLFLKNRRLCVSLSAHMVQILTAGADTWECKPRICYHGKLDNWPEIPHGVSPSSDIKLFGMFGIVPWSMFMYSIWPSIICISLNPGQNLLRWNSYALLQLQVFRHQFHVLFIFRTTITASMPNIEYGWIHVQHICLMLWTALSPSFHISCIQRQLEMPAV